MFDHNQVGLPKGSNVACSYGYNMLNPVSDFERYTRNTVRDLINMDIEHFRSRKILRVIILKTCCFVMLKWTPTHQISESCLDVGDVVTYGGYKL